MRVFAIKDNIFWVCQGLLELYDYRCGKCGRGRIKPKDRKCKVCNARIERELVGSNLAFPLFKVTK